MGRDRQSTRRHIVFTQSLLVSHNATDHSIGPDRNVVGDGTAYRKTVRWQRGSLGTAHDQVRALAGHRRSSGDRSRGQRHIWTPRLLYHLVHPARPAVPAAGYGRRSSTRRKLAALRLHPTAGPALGQLAPRFLHQVVRLIILLAGRWGPARRLAAVFVLALVACQGRHVRREPARRLATSWPTLPTSWTICASAPTA